MEGGRGEQEGEWEGEMENRPGREAAAPARAGATTSGGCAGLLRDRTFQGLPAPNPQRPGFSLLRTPVPGSYVLRQPLFSRAQVWQQEGTRQGPASPPLSLWGDLRALTRGMGSCQACPGTWAVSPARCILQPDTEVTLPAGPSVALGTQGEHVPLQKVF